MKLNLEALVRQQDLINFKSLATPITIIGAGAVGGTAAFFLSKMGMCNIKLFDFDDVDMVNMNCQMFGLHNIGQAKVDAIASTVDQWCGSKVQANNKAFTPDDWHMLDGIVLSGADSMAVRKQVFDAWQRSPSATHLIDTRMSIEYLAVYVISKDDKKSCHCISDKLCRRSYLCMDGLQHGTGKRYSSCSGPKNSSGKGEHPRFSDDIPRHTLQLACRAGRLALILGNGYNKQIYMLSHPHSGFCHNGL